MPHVAGFTELGPLSYRSRVDEGKLRLEVRQRHQERGKSGSRDASALELIITGGVEINKTPIEKERTEFTGTLEIEPGLDIKVD